MNFYIHAVEQALWVLAKADSLTIDVYSCWAGLQFWYFDSSPFLIHLLFVSVWDTIEILLFTLVFRTYIEEIIAGLFASWWKPT